MTEEKFNETQKEFEEIFPIEKGSESMKIGREKVWLFIKTKLTEATSEGQVEAVVSNDLVRETEEKFVKILLGIREEPQEYPGICYSNLLKAAYDQARAMKLSENLILKHCCTVLQKKINDHQTEKINQALNTC